MYIIRNVYFFYSYMCAIIAHFKHTIKSLKHYYCFFLFLVCNINNLLRSEHLLLKLNGFKITGTRRVFIIITFLCLISMFTEVIDLFSYVTPSYLSV